MDLAAWVFDTATMAELEPLLRRIKATADGQLPLAVYERLYRAAEACGGGAIVEIGTAQGAATIALALGAKASGKRFHIYTADPFDRGSRLAIGSVQENLALVRSGLEAFGVDRDVTVITGEAADVAGALGETGIALLLIDADGRIDRDLALLLGRLAEGAPVIIDDVDDRVYLSRHADHWLVDQKHRLTHLLARRFCDLGLLTHIDTVGQTGFFAKGPAQAVPEEMLRVALEAYRTLVFAAVPVGKGGIRPMLGRFLNRHAPVVLEWRRARAKRRE
jgi:predicted O-methyltransferase YrrM